MKKITNNSYPGLSASEVYLIYRPLGCTTYVQDTIAGNLNNIDQEKFTNYLVRFPEDIVRRRAGYILEIAGMNGILLDKLAKALPDTASFITLNPDKVSRRGRTSSRWGVIDNG